MRPDNPVVRLCAAGMRAEAEGQDERAHDLFERAWQQAGDDYEACIAAHYLARHRPTPEDTLRWNAESLRRARLADQDRTRTGPGTRSPRDCGPPARCPSGTPKDRCAGCWPRCAPGPTWSRWACCCRPGSVTSVPKRTGHAC